MTVPVTALPTPVRSAVTTLFGDRTPVIERYAHHLATTGVERGLVGPREVERLWPRHILNCAAVGALVPSASACADVGSGAGLPGLVLAVSRPDITVTLLEPLLRRVTWLVEVAEDLEVENVRIVRGRAEESAQIGPVDVCTARAVAELGRLAEWCLPLLRDGGHLLALKGRSAEVELAAAAGGLAALRVARAEVVRVPVDGVPEADATVVRLTRDLPRSSPSGGGADPASARRPHRRG